MPDLRPACFALCLLLACSAPGTHSRPQLAAPLAVWSYEDLPTQAEARAAFYAFAQERGIREVYLGVHELLRTRRTELADFIQEAAGRGIRVALLIGNPNWCLQPTPALELTRLARDFARDLKASGRPLPSSLHLDVEPHALKTWANDWQRLALGFLDLLESVKAELGGELPLAADIPVWWDGRAVKHRGQKQPLSDWVLQLADQTVLMDYRDTVPRILESAEGELKSAERLGKQVVIGLNTRRPDERADAPTTFYEEGQEALRTALQDVDAKLRNRRGYGGVAVFSDEHWRRLKR